MKKSLPFLCAVISISAVASPLTVNTVGHSPATYHCNDGTRVIANYYALSDKSLQFVKLNFDKTEVTLPAVISGSGSRYSDGYQTEWWRKGNSATLTRDINNKEPKLVECSVVP